MGRRGRRPLRIYANHTRVRNHHAARGWNPAPTGLAKARPESNPNACGVSPFPQRLLEEMRPFSASTTSVDISNKRRPCGAATSLFPFVSQVGQRGILHRSQPPAPKRRIGPPRFVGEAGGTQPVRWVLMPKKPLFFGAPPRFFWQGQKKWGGIPRSHACQRASMLDNRAGIGYNQPVKKAMTGRSRRLRMPREGTEGASPRDAALKVGPEPPG